MTLRFVSASNGFVPQATGQIIAYVRSPKDFKLNSYVQYIQTPATVGLYARMDRDQSVRVPSDADFVWADGADRPSGDWNQVRFTWVEFSTKRRNYPFRMGNIALKQSKEPLKILEQQTQNIASQAMVNRTHRVLTLLEETSNWDGHADSANSLNGGYGKWDTASDQPTDPHYNAIKKTLLSACERVNLATNAFVQPDDLVLVVSPGLAQRMANTAEIHNYVKYGPFSKEALEKGANARWGLPPTLYGFDVIVEDAVRVSSRMSADGTQASGSSRTYIKSDTSALLLSRKGGINGTYGTNSFATVQLYFYDWEMATYVFDDPKHERTDGHVTDCFAEVLAAPQAGYLITSVL